MRLLLALAATLALAPASAVTAQSPNVVATIKPLHALVAAVMGDVGSPALLVQGAASPHAYSLRPSDAAALEAADIVFRAGPGFEVFLDSALNALAANARVVALSDNPVIELLPLRQGGAFEPHVHDQDDHVAEHDEHHDDHEHEPEHDEAAHDHDDAHEQDGEVGAPDLHFWLDPVNALAMLTEIARVMADADPAHGETYLANAADEAARIQTSIASITASLAPVHDQRFIVLHDAYQYFERRFGLTAAGSITVTPDALPGAQRIEELRQAVAGAGVTCVFAEPQFQPAIIATIIEGTPARAGVLDPEGAALTPGPNLYRELIEGLAAALVDCLAGD